MSKQKNNQIQFIRNTETYDDDDDDYEQAQELELQNPDEKGFQKRIQQQQIFIFKAVNIPGLPKNEQVKKLVTSEDTKLIITKSNKIYRWRPKIQPQFKICQIALSKDKQFNIRNAYFDEKGTHCIITCSLGFNIYINNKQNKIKFLNKLKGLHVKAAAFVGYPTDQQPQNTKSSGDIIISSGDGIISILSVQIVDGQVVQHHQTPAITIPSSLLDIMAIQVIRLNQVSGKYLLVLLSTASAIHVILGQQQPISSLFKKYKQSSEKTVIQRENGGAYSSLRVCYSKISNRPTYVLWMNGRKLQLFKLPERLQKVTQSNCLKQEQIKLLKKTDVQNFKEYPIGIGITEFHYYILYSDSLTIISLVTKRIVLNEVFKNPVIGMVFQFKLNSFWIYDQKTITKLDTSRQGSDVWKVFILEKKFKEAYALCKAKNQSLAFVSSLYADDLFEKMHYTKAASLYAQTYRTFQQIFLKFLQVDTFQSRQGLQIYLNIWLSKLQPQKKTQRCLIISWLVQLIVFDINNLQKTRDSQKSELLPQKQSDLIQLLSTNLDVINDQLIYDIMMSYGRIKNLKQFAQLKNNIQKIIIHFLYNQQYQKAINYLESMTDLQQIIEVIYRHSYVFFSFQPQRTIDLLLKNLKKFQPSKLIPGLINIPRQKRSYGIQLLKYCIENLKQKSTSLHNLLIYFYVTSPRQKIPQMIDLMKKGKMYFNLDFGLRLFKTYSIPQAQIIVYGQMRMYQKAVILALQINNEQLAKQFANRPKYYGKKKKQQEKKSQKKSEVDEQKKKLWLQIAKYYLNKKQKMNQVIQITKQSKILKIQDLLPHFNQNIKLENFKDEISQSLRAYFQNINRLKDQMESYASNAEQLKSQEKYIEDRCFQINSSQKCEECFKTLYNSQFYMFPCMHGFHRECLFQASKSQSTMSQQKRQRINTLMQQIKTIKGRIKDRLQTGKIINQTSSNFSFMPNISMSMPNISVSNLIWSKNQAEKTFKIQIQQKEIKKRKDEITKLLAPQCIYCGPGLVESIVIPFNNPVLMDSWKV